MTFGLTGNVTKETLWAPAGALVAWLEAERLPYRLDPVLAGAGDLEHPQLALDAWPFNGQIVHTVNRYDPPKLGLDLLDHGRCAAGDDGDTRPMTFVIDFGDSQAVDIIAPARKQTDDARQHAGLIFDQNRQRMTLLQLSVGVAQIICRMAGRAMLQVECHVRFLTPKPRRR